MSEYQVIQTYGLSFVEILAIIDDNREIMAILNDIDFEASGIQETLKEENKFTPMCHAAVKAIDLAVRELTLLLRKPKITRHINDETGFFAYKICELIRVVCEDIDRVNDSEATEKALMESGVKSLLESARIAVKKVGDSFAYVSGFAKNPLKVAKTFVGLNGEKVRRALLEVDCGVKLLGVLKQNGQSLAEEALELQTGTARFADQMQRALLISGHHRSVVTKLFDLRKEAGHDVPGMLALDNFATGYGMADIFKKLRQFEQGKLRELRDYDNPLPWRGEWEGNVREEYSFTAVIEKIYDVILNDRCDCDVIHLYGKLFPKYGPAIDSVPVSNKASYRYCRDKQPACGKSNVFEKLTMTAADMNKTNIWGKQGGSDTCPICMEDLNEMEDEFGGCMLPCGHQYHKECIMPYIRLHLPWHLLNPCEDGCENRRPRQCPICKRKFSFLEAVFAVDERIRAERDERETRTEGGSTFLVLTAPAEAPAGVAVEVPVEVSVEVSAKKPLVDVPVDVPVDAPADPSVETLPVETPIQSAFTRSGTGRWLELTDNSVH
ncbi:hypothetical protein QBC40DRAFT_329051 [Triangularia verruculosa]|uniref:RING-type domain-containing protein n=1 Tax=Triangularia verruculosa TaxID=2587418 RepID=A0AAN7AZX3_9PEZI|nr:hypothetical protein QBC40DRAFT_329051 [Triangularia verruculosa]